MKTLRTISGVWDNREKTKAVLSVEELEDEAVVNNFEFGFDADDNAPVTLQLKASLQEDDSMVTKSVRHQILDGEIPVPEGMMILNGDVVDILTAKENARRKIRDRINDLYSGYDIALAERNPVYAKNRKRKIDNLMAMEADPDPAVNIYMAEDAVNTEEEGNE